MPQVFPPTFPIISYFDPNKTDQGLIEYFSTETPGYVPIDIGTAYPNTREYPGFRLGLQQAVPNNPGWIRRVYVTDQTNPDWFNAQEKFSFESVTHPIFIRSYREDRKTYSPRVKLTPLDTVIKVTVDGAGSGYVPETFPSLTFAGGGGSGAAGHAIVAADGTIADLVLDDGGSGYTSTPTFTIDAPVTGTTATGLAFIQPQTALLVAEETQEYPPDSEFSGLFFSVTRIYESLPGPILTTRTVGQDNLTPAKYRRLVRTEETNQPVAADYSFPPGITGDQTQIQLAEETVAKARLKIISEIIAISGDALIGGETNEFGALVIYESVVNEGTAIDQGFLVLKSTVTPFGNGKAVKITVKYPLDLAMLHVLRQSIGQDNLTPQKYRRLVQHVEDDQMVDLATYIFPAFLSNDQTEIRTVQETIFRARQTTVSEIIAISGEALIGGEGDEYGVLRIEESIVNEGTAIDTGFLIKHSSVTPFGNGKAVKITVIYTNAVIAAVKVTAGGSGGSNGTHTDGSFTGGSGSGGTFTYEVSGGVVLDSIVITNPGSGYVGGPPIAVLPSAGTGTTTVVYLAGPLLTSRLYDEEMQVHYDESRQIVMVGTPDSPDVDGISEETKALDIWRSLRVRTTKTPDATDSASAKISYAFQPYKFPGTLDTVTAYGSNAWLGYRSAKADLVQTTIRTWWEFGSTAPVVAFDEIISDTVVVAGIDRVERYTDVLHNGYLSAIGFATQAYPATTPSYNEYYLGTPSGSSTTHSTISLSNPGSGGYTVGDTLTLTGSGDAAQIQITAVQVSGYIYSWIVLDEGEAGVYSNPVTATGGTGSGAQFFVVPYEQSDYTPGTAWIGTERVVGATVTPEKEKHLWKVQTHSVVMR